MIQQAREPVQEQSAEVRLNRKPLIRGLAIIRVSNAPQLGGKPLHIRPASDMLNHRVGKSQIKTLVQIGEVSAVNNHSAVSIRLRKLARISISQSDVRRNTAAYLRSRDFLQYR